MSTQHSQCMTVQILQGQTRSALQRQGMIITGNYMNNINIHFNMTSIPLNFNLAKYLSLSRNYVSITRWNTFPRDLSQIQQLTGEGGLQDSLSLPLVYVHSHICQRKDRKTTVGISLDCASQEVFFATTHPFRPATFKMIHCGCVNIG